MRGLLMVCVAVLCASPCGNAEEKASGSSAQTDSIADRLLAVEKRLSALESRPAMPAMQAQPRAIVVPPPQGAAETPVGRLIFGAAANHMGMVVEKQDAARTLGEYAGQLKDKPLFVTNGGSAEAVLVPLHVLDSDTLAKIMKLYEQGHAAKGERAGNGVGHAERSDAADSR